MEENLMSTEVEFEGAEALGEAEVQPAATREKRVFTDNEGNELSMSAFIRMKFLEEDMSRAEISEQFDIPYRTVYGATVNMTNNAAPTSRGRSVTNPVIQVTANNEVLTVVEEDGNVTYLLNGAAISEDEAANLELHDVERNTWIKEQVEAGMNRGDVATALNISYGVVYGLTKEAEGTRQKHVITLEDGTEISRTDYIRQRVAEGMSKSELAKELGVSYNVIWQATKQEKTAADKYQDAIEALAKLSDVIVPDHADLFAECIETLRQLEVVSE